jgi:hypothetical protein
MARSAIIVSITLSCGLSLAARADDLTPPPWRFQPGTTFQHWDFSAGPNGGPPDGPGINLFNPYGTPVLIPVGNSSWQASVANRNNVWAVNGGGQLVFNIPNELDPPPHQKELWLQITFFAPAPIIPPGVTVMTPNGNFFTQIGGPFTTTFADGWTHQLTQWAYPECPGFEHVTIFPPQPGVTLFVDQVVIDTRCYVVPEPGVLAMLGVAGVVAGRRRR